MKAVHTLKEKQTAIQDRKEEQRRLGKVIDTLIADSQANPDDGAAVGCGGRGLCPSLFRGAARFLGISQRRSAVSTKEIEVANPASVALKEAAKRVHGGDISRAVLGLAGSKKKTPQSKLAAAAEAMRSRVESLESRASECRSSAQSHMRAGNKAVAMRELKRAKALEKQAVATQGAMDALEAQSDMLEQTQLQKEVAAALGATAKSLKKEKGLLSKAEDAVDAAAEMRDMHDDLSQVMAGLGDAVHNDVDEDELLAELDEMAGDADREEATQREPEAERAKQAAAEERKRQQEYADLERLRQLPAAPTSAGGVEKQSLLATA